jgi:4-amino-4-deoxy-L-arabinose transferase-like glycosyltransferase
MESSPRTVSWRDLALVFGAAAAVRIVAFIFNFRGNPAFDYPIMDSMHIDRWAKAIAAGEGSTGVYFRGPLVPYFLALLYKLTDGGAMAAVLANHVSGAVTCVLIYLLAREYFERAVAIAAGLVAALYWPMIYFEGEILIEPIFMMLAVLGLWLIARAASRRTPVRAVFAGAVIGLAALARPTILVVLPALPIVFALVTPRSNSTSERRRRLKASGLAVATAIAMLVPATIHNMRAGRAFVPVAWSGGLNFYIGNNGSSDGRSAYIPDTRFEWMGGEDEALAIAAAQAGRTLNEAQASSFYLRRGLRWIAANPEAAAALQLRKLHFFWEGPERSNEKYIYFFWDRFGLGRVPMPGFWLISPLALVAMIRLWSRRRELSLLYLFVLAYMLGVVAFFVVGRYRLPVVPVLIVFAAWTLIELFECAGARRWASVGATAVLFAACFVIANASYPSFLEKRPQHIAMAHYTLAGALMEKGDEDRALHELDAARRAYEKAPTGYYANMAQDVYFKLGVLWYERGRCDEAARAFGQVLPNNPRAPQALRMFAECCERMGMMAEAGRAYELLYASDSGDRSALEGLIRCLEATGRSEEADKLRRKLDAD